LPPEVIRQIFQTHGELPNWPIYYNAPPTTALPVVRQAKDTGNRELALMTWDLVPWFSKDGKPSSELAANCWTLWSRWVGRRDGGSDRGKTSTLNFSWPH